MAEKGPNGQGQEKPARQINDSIFAAGLSMAVSKMPVEIESRDFTGRAFEVLQYLSEADALTTSAVSILLNKYRNTSGQSLTCLWHACLVRWVTVATTLGIFKLWVTADAKPPRNAMEACRMAVLGLYYSRAKKEVPGFEWRLLRSHQKPVQAEMLLTPRGQTEKVKMIIDVPRRGEKPDPDANLYIFPTMDEAKKLVPNGKSFTTDLHLLKYDAQLGQITFEKA